MIRDFSREELQEADSNDTELTLGLGTVLGLGAGLVVLCGICFGLGYAAGHRSATSQGAAVVFPNAGGGSLPVSKGNKPGAMGQAEGTSSLAANAMNPTTSTARSDGDAVAEGADAQQPGGSAGEGSVKPALQVSASGSPATPLHVQPATSQVQGWMVQIAAVSRSEDADVLVNALRKRGYTASARRELGDNLIHVQTGPFPSRNDANEIRQKLLNDGYNAIVQ